MFFVFRCYLLPFVVVTLYVLNVPERHCKITTFPQTRKGMDEISLFTEAQQPGHGSMGKCGGWHLWLSCPFLLKEKDQKFKADIIGPYAQSGRFPAMSARPTRPTQSVFGVPIHSERSSHVIPALACALARNLWLRHLGICPSYYENPTLHIGVW